MRKHIRSFFLVKITQLHTTGSHHSLLELCASAFGDVWEKKKKKMHFLKKIYFRYSSGSINRKATDKLPPIFFGSFEKFTYTWYNIWDIIYFHSFFRTINSYFNFILMCVVSLKNQETQKEILQLSRHLRGGERYLSLRHARHNIINKFLHLHISLIELMHMNNSNILPTLLS